MRRVIVFLLGLITLAAAWLGPLPEMARQSFSAHMTMHMGVVAVAAPLTALGIARTRFDWTGAVPALFSPIPASIFELVVVWAWHAPGLHHTARQTTWGLVLEQGTFLVAGLLMWLSVFGETARQRRLVSGIGGLVLTAMHMTLLGALLALTPRALYGHTGTVYGMTALQDQHVGGAIMLLVGSAAYLAGGLWLTVKLLRRSKVDSQEGI